MHDVEAIRAQHPIVETVLAEGVELRRHGNRLAGRCPFHEDRDPSFVVYAATASYFCFGCGAGGDVIDFVGRVRGTPFRQTAAALAASTGGSVAPAATTRLPARSPRCRLDGEEATVIEAAVQLYRRSLGRHGEARAYLRNRGIGADVVRSLRLGYADGGLAKLLRRRGLSLVAAERLGLLVGEREPFAGRIVVPDLDAHGRARWFTGRTLTGRGPRYLNLRAPSPLLGLVRARLAGGRAVLVVEGPFDWLTACGWGIPAVALLGTHVSRETVRTLRSFPRVFIALDADEPGRRAAGVLASALGPGAALVALPGGAQDLSELGCLRGGRDAFLAALREARAGRSGAWQQATGRANRAPAA